MSEDTWDGAEWRLTVPVRSLTASEASTLSESWPDDYTCQAIFDLDGVTHDPAVSIETCESDYVLSVTSVVTSTTCSSGELGAASDFEGFIHHRATETGSELGMSGTADDYEFWANGECGDGSYRYVQTGCWGI